MTELKPCPFPGGESEEVQSECLGKKHHTINFELGNEKNSKRHIFLQVTGIAQTFEEAKRIAYELWNTRHYRAEVQQAVERMKPKKIIYDDSLLGKPGITEYSLAICPSCKQSFIFDENATEFKCCPNCGQRLDWKEDI